MKSKKNNQVEHITIPQRQRTPSSSQGITKRKQSNKENNIQITQPLQSILYPSKQFVLSKESLRGNLREISQNQPVERITNPKGQKERERQREREQQLFDRRLSLKCTTNFSQQLQSQKSHRLSVAPMRRESLGSNAVPQSLLQQRDSMSSYYQNSVFRSDQKQRPGRQAIITNFMQKLDHQEDLRSIIQSKLKNGPPSTCFSKDRRNQSYITDFTEQGNSSAVTAKLKQCENQIKYFKNAVKEMSEKIVQLTTDKDFKKKQGKSSLDGTCKNELLALIKQLGSVCEECDKRSRKESRDIGVQTTSDEPQQIPKMSQSFDFFDNLEKTLKVLDGKKH